jgi:hypothetical protein
MPTVSDIIEREHGGRNWVIARRTKNILRTYGDDVITLSPKEYRRLELMHELETADAHPAYELLKDRLGSHCDAVNTIKMLREAGFRIERVYP